MAHRAIASDRSVSPVVAVALLVALTVITATAVFVFAGSIAQENQPPVAETHITFDEVRSGMVAEVRAAGSRTAYLKVNGETLYEINRTDTGLSLFVPTAPGDRITVVHKSDDGSTQVVTSKGADEFKSGKFVALYRFDSGGSTVEDHSGNGNDGDVYGNPKWVEDDTGTALKFDGSGDDYVEVPQLQTKNVENVREFTVAVRYNVTGSAAGGAGCGNCDEIQQLVEHKYASGSFEWYLETFQDTGSQYTVTYQIWDGNGRIDTPDIDRKETHVLVGTYDGNEMRYYLDGTFIGKDDKPDNKVEMGELSIAADAPNENIQYLQGRIYELRLYYVALDEDRVKTLTEAMTDRDESG